MFAQVGYLSDTAILDLASGRTHHYAGMEQALGNGSISGALVTTDCLVLWQAGAISPSTARTLSFKVPLGTSTAPDLSADASIGLGSILGERRVVATEDGARVWIEAFGSSVLSPPDEAGRLEYVDCTSGDVLGTVQLGAQPGARSSFLFGAVGDQAVVVQDGGDVDERVLLVAPSGETTPLPSPSPARFIAAGAGRVLWSTPDGELLVTDATGQLLSTIASPVAGSQWLTAAAPIRDSPHQRTISLDGTRALVRLADLERDDGAHALYLVDFATGRAQRLDLGPGQPNSAVWSRDDTRIVGIVTSLSPTLIVQLDAATGTRLGAPRALPPQYFILGAG
jgi:hypothetical protein